MDNLVDLSNMRVDGSVHDSHPLWSIAIDNYRYVLFSTNKVLVYKDEAEEPTYEIDNYSCSCPASRYRSAMCKHRKAVSFVGDDGPDTPALMQDSGDSEELVEDSLDLDNLI